MPTDPKNPDAARVLFHAKETRAPGITIEKLTAFKRDCGTDRAVILRAESLGALARYLESEKGKARGAFERLEEAKTGSRKTFSCAKDAKEWDLGAGWDGAIDFARQGWPEGRRGLRAAAASLAGEFHPRPPQGFDVAGDWLDIPSAIAGDPESWGVDEEVTGRARIITLALPLSASWNVSATTLRNRGAAIAAIIDGLESEGIRCEIDAYSIHESRSDCNQAIIMHRVKEAGAHLSLDRLAASLIHPATFRRLHFAGLENLGGETCENFNPDCLTSGYGMAREMRPAFREILDQPGTYHLPMPGQGDWSDPKVAAATMREQMTALGFNFTPEPSHR